MFKDVFSFITRHQSFILITHDPPDADGLGAQLVFAAYLKKLNKFFRIINASSVPEFFHFMDHDSIVEKWDKKKHAPLVEKSALIIFDTSDEYHIGIMRDILKKVKETIVFDHHEPKLKAKLSGFNDPDAASVSELAVEFICEAGITLDPGTATAAYTGIVHDSGFFSYPKTSIRTFEAAIKTIEWGANPNYVYRQLMENYSCAALLLQKQALSSLEFHAENKIAVMIIRKEDLKISGANFDETEGIVNIPLKSNSVEVSVLIKEKPEGEIRCSLRSKGKVNVSRIAQGFSGGGHVSAAGFKSSYTLEQTLKKLLVDIRECLDMVEWV